MKRSFSLRAIITTQLSTLMLLPLLLVAGLSTLLLAPKITDETRHNQEQTAQLVANQIQSLLSKRAKQLTFLSTQLSLNQQFDRARRTLDLYVRETEFFEALYLIQPDGLVREVGLTPDRERVRNNLIGLDLSGYKFGQNTTIKEEQGWSQTFLSTISGKLSVAFTTHLEQHYLVGEIIVEDLPRQLKTSDPDDQTIMMILDEKGQLLAHTDEQFAGRQLNYSTLLPVSEGPEGAPQSGAFTHQRQKWFGSRVPLQSPSWSILVAQPFDRSRELINTALLILGISLTAGVAVVAIAALRSSADLKALFDQYANIINGLSNGVYEFDSVKALSTEFADLNGSLRKTASAIREREDALRHLNNELEKRVQVRTADLERSNRTLQEALSNLRKMQSELVQSEKLAALGSLVAGVAHELNTPIGVSVTTLSALESKLRQLRSRYDADEITRSDLEAFMEDLDQGWKIATRNLDKASELIKSFKEVAVDRTSSRLREFELKYVVEELIVTLSPMFKHTPYRLTVDIPEGLRMHTFPGPLGQVLTNLVSNALQHGLDGLDKGQITISAKQSGKELVDIRVTDDGRGITPQNRSRIFDPFFTTRLGNGGSGLGLPIVHNIVTQILQGQIVVDAQENKGTRVTLTLPQWMRIPPESESAADDRT